MRCEIKLGIGKLATAVEVNPNQARDRKKGDQNIEAGTEVTRDR